MADTTGTDLFAPRSLTRRLRWQIALAVVLAVVVTVGVAGRAAWSRAAYEGRSTLAGTLGSILEGTDQALGAWALEQEQTAILWAGNSDVVRLVEELDRIEASPDALLRTPAQSEIRSLLAPVLSAYGYEGFFVVNSAGLSLASTRDANTGTPNLVALEQPNKLVRILGGDAVITVPQFSDVPLSTDDRSADVPTMFVGAPVIGSSGEAFAALLFRIDPGDTFEEVFDRRVWGETGEVFAIDDSAELLAGTRFEDRLVESGLITDSAFRRVQVRSPDVELPADQITDTEAWPLTPMAASLVRGESGVNTDGYVSYLGYEVVGAWRWLPDLGFGIAVEQASDEALAGLTRSGRSLAIFIGVTLVLIGLMGAMLMWSSRERSTRRAIEDQAQRLQAILNQTSDGIVIVDRQGTIRFANAAIDRLLGYRPDELVGRPVDALIPSGMRVAHERLMGEYLQDPDQAPRLMAENRSTVAARKRDGATIPTSIALGPVEIGDTTRLVVAAIRDETGRNRAEERIRRSNQELERFVAVAAHDLQEPLRKILAFASILEDEGPELQGVAGHALDRIADSADQMRELIDGLLAYSRVARKEDGFEIVALSEVVAAALGDMGVAAENETVSVRVDDLPAIVADREQIKLLFEHLIDNALKFRRREEQTSTIEITSRPEKTIDGGGHRIVVSDNGIGFDKEYSERIFETFRRLHGRGEFEGIGMGLAICRRIVERHGGTIYAKSSPGAGASFEMWLPEMPPTEDPPGSPLPTPLGVD